MKLLVAILKPFGLTVLRREDVKVAAQALDDWVTVHASDCCGDDDVAEAKARIAECGTIAYACWARMPLDQAL